MKTKQTSIGIIAIALATGTSALAADLPVKAPPPSACAYDILRANNQVSVDYATTNFNYREFNEPPFPPPYGYVVDSETGWVPGVAVTGSYMTDCLSTIQNLYVYSRTTYLSGQTAYWEPPPGLTGKNGATVWDGDYRIGKGFQLSTSTMVTPYFGAGYDWWKRSIQVGAPFTETYSHGYAGAGLLLQITPAPRWVLSAYGFGGGTFSSQMYLNPSAAALPSTGPAYTFTLGNSATAKAGASVDFAITDRWHANAGVDYTYFRYGGTGFNPYGTLEPPSTTSNWMVTAGLGYSFYSGGETCCALVTK
jgi:hypothetical protein